MKKIQLKLLIASNFIFTLVHASTMGLPDAGAMLQQVQPQKPLPLPPREPRLMIEKPDGQTGRMMSGETFLLQRIKLSGVTIFERKILRALVKDAIGQNISLSQLVKLASRITDYYRDQGYPLTRTIIPAQSIENGVVNFLIIEPRYGKITLDNLSSVRNSLLQSTISTIHTGQFVEESTLDHALLMLSDVAGITVIPALRPGLETGTSDLIINTTSGPAVGGHVGLDNHGNKYTGEMNADGALTINNPFGYGDTFNFNALTSGQGMSYKSLAYESLINGKGTHLGGSISSLAYAFKISTKADQFIEATGSAKLVTLWAKQTLWRSREKNIYGRLTYEQVSLKDHLDGGTIQSYKDRHTEMLSATLSGDFRDSIFLGGNTSWNLRPIFGKLIFDNELAQIADGVAHTSGSFSKLVGSLTVARDLGERREFVINVKGQWANRNLDSTQKMSAGGAYSVRAYAPGTASGDQGLFISAEYKQPIGTYWGGAWSATAFADQSTIAVNKNTWSLDNNLVTLTGAGLGLHWVSPYRYSGTAYIAAPIASKANQNGANSSVQISLEIQKNF
jgi:hemolysin activation/secretion protein